MITEIQLSEIVSVDVLREDQSGNTSYSEPTTEAQILMGEECKNGVCSI